MYRKREVLLLYIFSRKCNTVLQNILAWKLRYSATADTMDFQPFVIQVSSWMHNDFMLSYSSRQYQAAAPGFCYDLKKQQLAAAAAAAAALIRSLCLRCPHSLSLSPLLSFALFVSPGVQNMLWLSI